MWKKIKPFAISISIALGVGVLSALLTNKNMELYQAINRPSLSPPSWLFPAVWTVLYILMGISSALVCREKAKESILALLVYGIQLFVNFCWTLLFFNLRSYLFSFIWLIFLLALILWMIYEFYRVNRLAALLQIPYFLWVLFAGYLNLMIYLLNR